MTKVVVIGIDAATYELVERWKDSVPNLARLINDGVYGKLMSSTPPDSCPAWMCFYTGKNPGKIGVYGFVNVNNNQATIVDASMCDSVSLWEILGQHNKRVRVINVPMTYPPRPVNGYLIAGFPTPFSKKDFAYPPQLHSKLDKLVGGYQTDTIYSSPHEAGAEAFLKELRMVHKKIVKTARHFIRKKDWDFFMVVFREIDYVQHYFWKYMDIPGEHKFQNVIRDYYVRIDKIVGELLSELNMNDTYVFIMSDHGCQGAKYKFYINEWLKQKGLLHFRTIDPKHERRASTNSFPLLIVRFRKFILRHISPILIKELLKIIPRKILMKFTIRGILQQSFDIMLSDIDWAKTRAYALGGTQGKIYINSEHGNSAENYTEIRDKIEKMLSALSEDLRLKGWKSINIYSRFSRKESIYQGKHVSIAPDLVADFFVNGSKCFVGSEIKNGEFLESIPTHGTHSDAGVWIVKGPSTKKVRLNARIIDLAPTILYLLNTPIPTDIDGKVLKTIFTLEHELKYEEPLEGKLSLQKKETTSDQEELKKRLEALGYLG